MTSWHVYTDGSALTIDHKKPPYIGGWAAVVEHGSDGFVVRGRVAKTTSLRMELRAVIEGLSNTPEGEHVVLHTDCSTVMVIKLRLEQHQLPSLRNCAGDQKMWLDVASLMAGRVVVVSPIPKGGHPIHARAHKIAKAEARALDMNLPDEAQIEELPTRKQRRRWDDRVNGATPVRDAFAKAASRERQRLRLHHDRYCEPGVCCGSCEVWKHFGYSVA